MCSIIACLIYDQANIGGAIAPPAPMVPTPMQFLASIKILSHENTSYAVQWTPSNPDTLGPVQWTPSNPDTLGPVQWNPSNPDTLGPESTVLIIEVSSFQGLEMYCGLL